MSTTQILHQLPKLSMKDRQKILKKIFEIDRNTKELWECDARANQRFLILDQMEASDAKTKRR
ncbi:MAG: hypothetical protein ACOY3I_10020 [Verrucomicrobiota bacterium]